MIEAIDAHQHYWTYSASEYPWIQADWPIRKDFLPTDLAKEWEAVPVGGCVAVQARQSLEETRWLLELADQFDFVRGVVGWVELRSDKLEEQLRQFSSHPKFVGVRHVVQDEPNDDFMLGEAFQRGIGRLAEFDLTYDILIYPRQLPAAIRLVERFPHQPFVLDHLAKPLIKERKIDPWKAQIRELASFPNVQCKLSGVVTEADWHQWKADDFRPYFDVVSECFGSDRLMFGSDWPVCLLAGSYERVHSLARSAIASWPEEDAEKFFRRNATRFYGLDQP